MSEQRCDASNIVLIGMPGAGKSTVGVILAKMASLGFIDTDVLIQASERRSLQSIIDSQGYMALRGIEERILLGLECRRQVIATGGSAVYSAAAMAHLAVDGVIVFLDIDLVSLESRGLNLEGRGIAKRPDQSFAELFEERRKLYTAYADVTVDCRGLTHDMVCAEVLNSFHPVTPDEKLLVSDSERSAFLSRPGNQGIARRRTSVRCTSKPED